MVECMSVHALEGGPLELHPAADDVLVLETGVVAATAVAHPASVSTFGPGTGEQPALGSWKDLLRFLDGFEPAVISTTSRKVVEHEARLPPAVVVHASVAGALLPHVCEPKRVGTPTRLSQARLNLHSLEREPRGMPQAVVDQPLPG